MFAVYCHGHGGRLLLGPDAIEKLVWGARGVEVHWRDGAGHTGVWRPAARLPHPLLRAG